MTVFATRIAGEGHGARDLSLVNQFLYSLVRRSQMKALIQKHRGEFANINVLTAFLGFTEKGYFIEFFEFEELSSKELDDETIVVGGIPVVVSALTRLGITPPGLVSIPESISSCAGRRTWEGSMGEVRSIVDRGGSIFIKPLPNDRKLFAGKVVTNYRDLAITASLPGGYPVICSEPVSMISEYRVFVLRGTIVGCRHYKGDFRAFPDFKLIESAVLAYADSPSGYGIDFAVTESGETILVEVNEGFSLGCYGLPSLPYSSIIEARWEDFRTKTSK